MSLKIDRTNNIDQRSDFDNTLTMMKRAADDDQIFMSMVKFVFLIADQQTEVTNENQVDKWADRMPRSIFSLPIK